MRIVLIIVGIPFAILVTYLGDSIWQQMNKMPDPHEFENAEVYCQYMLGEYTAAIGTRELDLGRTSVVCMTARENFPQEFVRAANGTVSKRSVDWGFSTRERFILISSGTARFRGLFVDIEGTVNEGRFCERGKPIAVIIDDPGNLCIRDECSYGQFHLIREFIPVCFDHERREIVIARVNAYPLFDRISPPSD